MVDSEKSIDPYSSAEGMLTCIHGETPEFWKEMIKYAAKEGPKFREMVNEIASLRAKTSFYESRIKSLNDFMKLNIEVKP